MSFPINVPGGGGGGISQLTGGVVAGPGSGSVTAEVVPQVLSIDCTVAGTTHPAATITGFDGTYVTVSGLGASGASAIGYSDITQAGSPNLYGPALSGSAATVTAFDGVHNLATISGLTGMYANVVGKSITISGSGNVSNNGTFVIAAYISATSVQINNASAVSPDTGPLTWSIPVGTLDGLYITMTVDAITYGSVLNVTNHAGLFEIQTTAPTSLVTGNSVVLTNSGNYYANGAWTITVIDSTHFTLDGAAFSGTFTYNANSTIKSGPTALTFSGAGNAASASAMLAAFSTQWPTVTATVGGYYGTGLSLTGTTLGPTGSITVVGGSAQTYLQLYNNALQGSAGVDTVGRTPTALLLATFDHAGNNGTFLVHSWLSSSSVTVLNPAGASPDIGRAAQFPAFSNVLPGTLYGPALSGTGAAISSFTTPLAIITGLSGMTPAIVGQSITFSGFANSGNNGPQVVAGYISPTSVTINNTSAVSPDSGGTWSVPDGTLDGLTIIMTVDGTGPTTLTLNTSTNASSLSALIAAMEATWTTLAVSLYNYSNEATLSLKSTTQGPTSNITVGSGTANNLLGLYSTWSGEHGSVTYAISLANTTPAISGVSLLSLTGTAVSEVYICTQSCPPFRCLVENGTNNTAVFQAANAPVISPASPQAVSFDGTTMNYDTPSPGTPPSYAVANYQEGIGGGVATVDPNPNAPFTVQLTGNGSGLGVLTIDASASPFYGLVSNQSNLPSTVTNNGTFSLASLLMPGETKLILSDGASAIWSIPTVTEDNGRVRRGTRYYTQRAATATNVVTPYSRGADLVWGTLPVGGPFTNGSPPPYVDGSFDTGLWDVEVGADLSGGALAGADIAVLGNILYASGYPEGGGPTLYAFHIANGTILATVSLAGGVYLPSTMIAFKETADPTSSLAGPTDCVFIVSENAVATYALNGNSFTVNYSLSGAWGGSRGILIMGDDAVTSLSANRQYASIGVWTDPNAGYIWAADVQTGSVGQTAIYTGGFNPRAICLDKGTENFWVAFDGSSQIQYLNLNMTEGDSLSPLTVINTISYPSGVGTVDDMLFDGAFLWVLDVSTSTYCQLTPNGIPVVTFTVQSDSSSVMNMLPDSRFFFDGTYVYITGLSRNNVTAAIARISPQTGYPVEYFNFPTYSTRGMAFYNDDVFVATAPTIDTNVSTINAGGGGTIATSSGGFADFQDTATPANWGPGVVGTWIAIQSASNVNNNGFYLVTSWTSSTEITINNPNANISGETNNGFLNWQMYGSSLGIQRLSPQPPGIDYGSLVSIIETPAVAGWTAGLRLGARVVEYTGYSSPNTFNLTALPVAGTRVLFIDRDGDAGKYPLTISTYPSTTNGQGSWVLQNAYGYLELEWNGSNWLVVRQSFGGYQTVYASTNTPTANVLTTQQSIAAMINIGNGGVSGAFIVESQLTPSAAAGNLFFVRNSTAYACTFGFNGGGTISLSGNTSALVTTDGFNALTLMNGT